MSLPHAAVWPALDAVHTIVFDFDGVFTDNKVYVNQGGEELVRCDRADGLGLDFLRRFRDEGRLTAEAFILSKETNPVVQARARKLRLPCVSAVGDKLAFLEQRLSRERPSDPQPFAGLIYLGNDLNDLPVIERAGFSVAPADAHPLVRRAVSVVLERPGGHGFVREFIERLFNISDMSAEDLYGLVRNC